MVSSVSSQRVIMTTVVVPHNLLERRHIHDRCFITSEDGRTRRELVRVRRAQPLHERRITAAIVRPRVEGHVVRWPVAPREGFSFVRVLVQALRGEGREGSEKYASARW